MRISPEQLQELSPEQQEKLREWWKDHKEEGDYFVLINENGEIATLSERVNGSCNGYWNCECAIDDGEDPACRSEENSLPLLSIGQLIQLLDPKEETIFTMMRYIAAKPQIYKVSVDGKEYFGDTMCDCLWQAVKEIL